MRRWALAATVLAASVAVAADGKNFRDQDHTGKSFRQATLNGANFTGATLVSCDFTQASLKKAKFNNAIVTYATFLEADLTEADFTGVTSPGQYIQFTRCRLDKAKLGGLNKKNSLISLCFRGECSLKGADLRKSKIGEISMDCNLGGADLRGASLRAAFTAARAPRLTGALYDDDTAFPDGFDPKEAGMVLKEDKGDDAAKKKDK